VARTEFALIVLYSEAMQGLSLLKKTVFCRFRIQQAGSITNEDKPFPSYAKVESIADDHQPRNYS
jgi:Lon protease-like protein